MSEDTTRFDDGRLSDLKAREEHIAKFAKPLSEEFKSRLEIPINMPPGLESRWVRESVLNERDMNRIPEMLNKGWVFTPISWLRNHHAFNPFDKKEQKYIRILGLIHMHRPIELGNIERKKYQELVNKTLLSCPGTDKFRNETGMNIQMTQNDIVTARF